MRNLPTDLQILDAIYEMCFDEYASFTDDGPNNRLSKVYVPLNIEKIAAKLATEGDIVFGRLYYVLERKYAYKDETDGSLVPFFAAHSLSPEFHCIHFPYMASVLAQLRQEHRTARNNIIAAGASAIFAALSFLFAVWGGR